MADSDKRTTVCLKGDSFVRCTVPWFLYGTEYAPLDCTFKMLNCGEATFGEVHRAIKAAKHSVYYICWGFQPSMHFIRDEKSPPIGRLLEEVASRGVKVKVLCWAIQPGKIEVAGGVSGEPNTPGRRSVRLPWPDKTKGGLKWSDRPDTHSKWQYEYDKWWYSQYDIDKSVSDHIRGFFIDDEGNALFMDEDEAKIARKNLEFLSRGFSAEDRAELAIKSYEDKNISKMQRGVMAIAPTHHQKVVLIDVESPDDHIAFVMGHNTLDAYWDTPGHSYYPKEYHIGRNGKTPLQDISSRVTGPIVGDLYSNFRSAWEKAIADKNNDIANDVVLAGVGARFGVRAVYAGASVVGLVKQLCHTPMPNLSKEYFRGFPLYTSKLVTCEPGKTETESDGEREKRIRGELYNMTTGPSGGAMILRTHIQKPPRYDIRDTYKHVVKMAAQYIYIENQYFRWPPMADWIRDAADIQFCRGRDTCKHGSLYVFVVTNSHDDGVGHGTQKTYEMFDRLGRADAIPGVARQNRIDDLDTRIKQAEKRSKKADNAIEKQRKADQQTANTQPGLGKDKELQEKWKRLNDEKSAADAERDTLKAERDKLAADTEFETIVPEERAGLKVHICTLVAPDTPEGNEWPEVYIHSKLILINDTYMMLGSANINTRSMEVDTELNIAHYRSEITKDAREELWNQHTREMGAQDDVETAFNEWANIIDKNRENEEEEKSPICSLRGFLRTNPKISNLD